MLGPNKIIGDNKIWQITPQEWNHSDACECSFSSYSSVCDKNKSEVDTSGHYIFTMNLLIKEHSNKLKFTQ